ncbi:rRNA maturation RNase YbeY [candidate division KSB1 bacterium]|nr:rRNA maturation RNase YbeY [candidate division KSB1 bacterium]
MKKRKRAFNLSIEKTIDFVAPETEQIQKMVQGILDRENIFHDCEFTVIFIDDVFMIDLHQRFLQTDETTDVMAFDLSDTDKVLEGEIYINVVQAERQAQEYGVGLQNELFRLTAHGVLHLLGYDDQTEALRLVMAELEDQALDEVNSSRRDS